jgi:prolyl-tRNA synthetase
MAAKKSEDFALWYSQLVQRAELIEYYEISGCYILRPWAYEIWEFVQSFLDKEFKKLGVKNSYFPMFVPKKNLETEKSHVEGFSAEVAWVTHSGETKLEEPIAVRPTSETIMYPAFAKWIRSHRDLPLKLNQWCNVVRWEFKDPTPFIRSREFLWQEGHTAFATYEEAEKEVYQILDIYSRAYHDLLSVSVIKGRKTEYEKFAGGDFTTTVEGFIPENGRGVQAATSHHLGTNFSKMFDIKYLGEDGTNKMVYQNSWGFTTRSLGVMFMNHADDKGLVLPPRVSPIQVVFVPIYFKDKATLNDKVAELGAMLETKDLRVKLDTRENVNPGFKFNEWELKGVPLRVELGPKDMEKEHCVVVRRDTGEKMMITWDNFAQKIADLLETIQNDLHNKAVNAHNNAIVKTTTWEGFMEAINTKRVGLVPWCGVEECEAAIKLQSAKDSKGGKGELSGAAKSLCIPFEQPEEPASNHCCVKCDQKAIQWVLFGRSY